jgi:hypothetical protein
VLRKKKEIVILKLQKLKHPIATNCKVKFER